MLMCLCTSRLMRLLTVEMCFGEVRVRPGLIVMINFVLGTRQKEREESKLDPGSMSRLQTKP